MSGNRRFFMLLAMFPICAVAQPARPLVWETCSVTDGKGDSCGPSDPARPFPDFLAPGAWLSVPGDYFSADFQFDLKHPEGRKVKAAWTEVAKLASHPIRRVDYSANGSVFGSLLLAATGRATFKPLMKWSGFMPEPAVYSPNGIQVLAIAKDFGGNIPMVRTWAWMWGAKGPVRLDVSAAMQDAIRKAAPGYSGYETEFDWVNLHGQTWIWKGEWPGKVGVDEAFEAWFELGSGGLTVKSARKSRSGT